MYVVFTWSYLNHSQAVSMTYKLYKIMKDHKNPKVLSEGISWMVSAVEDFGVSHIKLKVLSGVFSIRCSEKFFKFIFTVKICGCRI